MATDDEDHDSMQAKEQGQETPVDRTSFESQSRSPQLCPNEEDTVNMILRNITDGRGMLPQSADIDSRAWRRVVQACMERDSVDIHELRRRELASSREERGSAELCDFIGSAIGPSTIDGTDVDDDDDNGLHTTVPSSRQVPFYVARLLEGGIRDLKELVDAANSENMKMFIPRASDRRLIEGKLRTIQAVEPPGAAPDTAAWQWRASVPSSPSTPKRSQVQPRSLTTPSSVPEAIETTGGRWMEFASASTELLEAAYRSGRRYSAVAGPYDQLYIVDLRLFTQTNLRTGFTRQIRRRISGSDEGVLIPSSFLCPITYEPMLDPVVAADGHSYSRAGIERWLTDHVTSPKTGLALENDELVPNHALRGAVEEILYSRSLQR